MHEICQNEKAMPKTFSVRQHRSTEGRYRIARDRASRLERWRTKGAKRDLLTRETRAREIAERDNS